jgi:2-dehydrotetronate isomerase
MPKFAANLTMLFNELPFLDRFAAAKQNGFDAVEFLFPYEFEAEQIADRLRTSDLKQVLFNLPPGNWADGMRGMAALPACREEFRHSVAQAIGYARTFCTPNLHVMAGIADPSDAAAMGCYRQSLIYAADEAGAHGIGITIEPLNGHDMPGYFLHDFDLAAQIIADLGLPNLKLQFDIYHCHRIGSDVLAGLQQFMPIIGHIQIASAPDRHEPGSGDSHDLAVLRALDGLGYDGVVGCEYRPAGGTIEGLGWLKIV